MWVVSCLLIITDICLVIILCKWPYTIVHDLGTSSLKFDFWWIKAIKSGVCMWNCWSDCWAPKRDGQFPSCLKPVPHIGKETSKHRFNRQWICCPSTLSSFVSVTFSCIALWPHLPGTSMHRPLSCCFTISPNLSFHGEEVCFLLMGH